MSETFAGFPEALFDFFRELSGNNKREWFNANKDRYKHDVVAPMSAFITAMAPRLAAVSTHYVADPRPTGGSMFRIYRDVRFSKDKRPYKEHAACHFRHAAGKDAHVPGFYVHLSPAEVFFGGGIWLPPSEALRRIREAIKARPAAWREVVEDEGLLDCFGGIAGDGLKRPPKGFTEDDPHIGDIKRKSFFAMRRGGPEEALSEDFPDRVAAAFRASTPLMRFLSGTLGYRF